jgi:hypothetical protein
MAHYFLHDIQPEEDLVYWCQFVIKRGCFKTAVLEQPLIKVVEAEDAGRG